MLLSLNIKNFTLVNSLEVDFTSGMTAITGETGAGKSLTLDALSMALGDRADSNHIRHGADRADVAATFAIKDIPEARQWLVNNDFDCADDHLGECLMRRLFNNEGRSRGYINGQPATMQQLQKLGELLIDIHSQHDHQSLLRKETHRKLLDSFGDHHALCSQTTRSYQQWQDAQHQFNQLSDQSSELSARRDLLCFQVAELNELSLIEGEVDKLEAQQKLLANAESILADSHSLAAICSDDDNFNLILGLTQASRLLNHMPSKNQLLLDVEELLNSARIQTEEAVNSLHNHIENFELDPEKLQQVEARLSLIYQLTRKHRVQPSELVSLHQSLQNQLQQLSGGEQDLDTLSAQAEQLRSIYLRSAEKLSIKRHKSAKKLCGAVNQHFPNLAMPSAKLSIDFQPLPENHQSSAGIERIEFLVQTNLGQPYKPLAKIASGGELSRISLAIQVVTAHTSATPTLVFDEVDVGVGGATAEVVGRLLRQLAEKCQVICVTHLPQVASCAHQQMQVEKTSQGNQTCTELNTLSEESRIEEIARMLGGMTITDQTRTHAREMLDTAH
jgi:DNA repair protein RecN (Recombination protein N)